MRNWLVMALTVVAVTLSSSPNAAEIDAKDGGVIVISGEIVKGDAAKFAAVAVTAPAKTLVILSSGGGGTVEGMMIGEAIRARHFQTGIPNGATCASACGLIWLAGQPRYIGESGNVGFHAAYVVKEGVASEVGNGNALVGAYLSHLGLSYDAIYFITSAAPEDMAWLHPSDAKRLGIDVIPVPKKSDEAQAPSQVAQLPDGSPTERKIMSRIVSYYTDWSRGGPNIDAMSEYYKDSVLFYGVATARSKLIEEKRNFSVRWPVRKYTVRLNTLFAKCSEICSVSGVVEWDVASAERNAHSTGTANFVVKFDPNNAQILAEDGTVLSSHMAKLDSVPLSSQTIASLPTPVAPQSVPQQPIPSVGDGWTPEQIAASKTTPFASGRGDRIDYEQWFDALAPGIYREGAMFWAESRSVKPTPTCEQVSRAPLWAMGCVATKARLDSSDYRRKIDRNYWLGWNSL